jgi:hypothetical protein
MCAYIKYWLDLVYDYVYAYYTVYCMYTCASSDLCLFPSTVQRELFCSANNTLHRIRHLYHFPQKVDPRSKMTERPPRDLRLY